MTFGGEQDINRFIAEIQGMREDFRRVSQELGELTSEVRHLAKSQEQTQGYGERIRSAETEISNLKQGLVNETNARESSERSAATERRWVIGLLIGTVIALLGLAINVFKMHP